MMEWIEEESEVDESHDDDENGPHHHNEEIDNLENSEEIGLVAKHSSLSSSSFVSTARSKLPPSAIKTWVGSTGQKLNQGWNTVVGKLSSQSYQQASSSIELTVNTLGDRGRRNSSNNHLEQVFQEAAAEEEAQEEIRHERVADSKKGPDRRKDENDLQNLDDHKRLLLEFQKQFHCQRIREFAAYDYDNVSPVMKSIYRFSLACPSHIVMTTLCSCFLIVFMIQAMVVVSANRNYQKLNHLVEIMNKTIFVLTSNTSSTNSQEHG